MRRSVLGLLVSSFVFAASPLAAQPSGDLADGLKALEASDYATADASLTKAKGPEADLALGRSALEQGRYDEAEKHAQAASSLKDRANVLRAEILIARGKTKDALALLETLKNGPKNGAGRRAKLLLGELLINTG